MHAEIIVKTQAKSTFEACFEDVILRKNRSEKILRLSATRRRLSPQGVVLTTDD
jgi:hypothetical protein